MWEGFNESRAARVALIVIGVLVLAVAVFVFVRPNPNVAKAGQTVGYLPPSDAAATSDPAPKPVTAPPGTRVVFIGDSWTTGYGATKVTDGYAWVLAAHYGWKATMLGVGSTGYGFAREYDHNGAKPYRYRFPAAAKLRPQLVVIQGGLNDLPVVDTFSYPSDVVTTMREAKAQFPQVLIVGPCPDKGIVGNDRLAQIDRFESESAAALGLHYTSCIKGNWFTQANIYRLMNKTKNHPNTAGYRYLAEHIEADWRRFVVA